MFFLGVAMAAGGGYMLLDSVQVRFGEFFSAFGAHTFGLALVPLMAGVGVLFFDGGSRLGWLLTVGGLAIVLLGVLMQLRLGWGRTTLWNVLVMVSLLSAGIGLVARSLRDAGPSEEATGPPGA